MPDELDRVAAGAGRALLALCGLMAAHGILSVVELRLLLVWPAGAREAHDGWLAAMATVVDALGHAEGLRDMRGLSEHDQLLLAARAYELVLDSPVGEGGL